MDHLQTFLSRCTDQLILPFIPMTCSDTASHNRHQLVPVLAGAAAGLAADLILFPLDPIKTRLQAKDGLRAAGRLSKLYAGIASASIGSIPSAAIFFVVYEMGRKQLPEGHLSNGVAAAAGETIACTIRVPVEVVKQRTQAAANFSSLYHFKKLIASEGVRGLYRGFGTMIARELPFSLIQFPVWEGLKATITGRSGRQCSGSEAMVCGATAGAVAAFLTNPLDVSKTRVMLAEKGSQMSYGSVYYALKTIHSEKGLKGLFAGVTARVMWISIGGAIFLGVYEKSSHFLDSVLQK